MDSNIDFSNYTLHELQSSAKAIDRELYPERAKLIDELIQQKQQEPEYKESEVVAGEMASRGHRFAAAIVDLLIVLIVFIPYFIYYGFEKIEEDTLEIIVTSFLYGALSTLIIHGYLLYTYGQTVGKYYMGIRIENLDGTQASFSKIFFQRILPMQLISLVPVVGQYLSGVINPLFIFGKQQRCLHDYIAKTKVSYVDIDNQTSA
ncbi:RDD family protein [uncultured Psychrosphaera sp.]|uniref:RDD family protein n=1 Tax=uncultured Psychrosphaera sp. TaxID=1403522 RepID=UPI0030FA270B